MECANAKRNEKRPRKKWSKSFTEALKEKYCKEYEETFNFIIISPKRKSNSSAELGHLQTVVLNNMDLTRADIPHQGLKCLCPNVVDLDLANNLLENWSELLDILTHLPKVKYVNVSRNRLRLKSDTLPDTQLSVENLVLNATGATVQEVVELSKLMPRLKELHLCDNDYETLSSIEESIEQGSFPSIECLRLNNNAITSWSEVWKLRHLPKLKFLILSGNPITDVFYKQDHSSSSSSDNHNNTTTTTTTTTTIHSTISKAMTEHDQAFQIDSCQSNQGNSAHDQEAPPTEDGAGLEHEDISIMDMSDECDRLLMGDLDLGDEAIEEEEEDEEEMERPVSRFARHVDSECSDYSSSEPEHVDSEGENMSGTSVGDTATSLPTTTTTNSNNTTTTTTTECQDNQSSSNSNSNNSQSFNAKVSLYDNDTSDFFAGYNNNDAMVSALTDRSSDDADEDDDDGADVDDEENAEDWHRIAAEAFLYDIIESLDFGESNNTITNSPALTGSEPKTSPHDTISTPTNPTSTGNNKPSSNDLNNLHNLNLNQKTVLGDDALAAGLYLDADDIEEQSDVSEGDIFIDLSSSMSGGNDEFTPRAFSMLDDNDVGSLAHSFVSPSPKSKAQRNLFPEESIVNDNSKKSDARNHTDCSTVPEVEKNAASCEDSVKRSENSSCESCKTKKPGQEKTHFKMRCYSESASGMYASTFQQSSSTAYIHIGHAQGKKADGSSINTNNNSSSNSSSNTAVDHNINKSTDVPDPSKVGGQAGDTHTVPIAISPSSLNADTSDTNTNTDSVSPPPFHQLQMLCMSNAGVSHWHHLRALNFFPKLSNLRLMNNPLYSGVNMDDRRKLYIASLPKVQMFNGSEVTSMEREKAERFYLRHYMDTSDKPEFYHTLVKKHGPPVELVDIDLGAGFQEWANLTFVLPGMDRFTRRIHLVEPISRLRTLIAQTLYCPKHTFIMYHHACGPSHPESEREFVELRCESMPMSRFDFAEGDEIHIDTPDARAESWLVKDFRTSARTGSSV